ncbi:hypothetical protein DVT68_00025 [Dyella solisilvae]|uniref:OmpR/PhoB-type domain-containing protein n=1 Tax=Dyella solisilvae TaxID=1920168 RepID=A0A370K9G9_9GAMM|nr:winged helix-turn-helix domain-containing protein [Dyella solisilvae]RDI99291.1 hypothetical protein DVT68_00025 [Dyella solisilvae]
MAAESASASWLAFDRVEIDTLGHRLFVDGEEKALERKAFAVLVLLASEPGRAWSRDEILDSVWGHSHVTPGVLSRIIAVLRHALGETGEVSHYLHTVHGIGFRLDAKVRSAASREELMVDGLLTSMDGAGSPAVTIDVSAPLAPTAATTAMPLQPGTNRRVDRRVVGVIVGLLAVAAGLLGWQQYARRFTDGASVVEARSIAVLPFENLSADQNNAYFASGIQDMILTKLVGIGGVKVISRTSTEKYPSHPQDTKAIAGQLGVATLLEGTVQKAGNRVLVNVQLVDPYGGGHLWAQDYTRTLDDVLNVEGEVAENVAEALKVQLTSAEAARIARVPTRNATAYDLYLQAAPHANRAYDLRNASVDNDLDVAISLYQRAVALDPDFALAWAALARANMSEYHLGEDRSNARLVEAKAEADRALALQPNLGEGHYALALYHYWGHRDYAAAMTELELARLAMPNSGTIVITIAWIARRQGRWDEALALFHAAAVLDPRNGLALTELGDTYQDLRRYAEADRAYAAAIALGNSNAPYWRFGPALNAMLWKGDLAPLRVALAAGTPGTDYNNRHLGFVNYERWLARDYAGAARAAEEDKDEDWYDQDGVIEPRRLVVAWALEAAGDKATATTMYGEVATRACAALADRPDDANLHLALAYAYAGLGRRPEAVAEGERAAALVPVTRDALTGPDMLVHLAEVYVRSGQSEKAIALIGRLLTMPVGSELTPALLRIDPVWDPLRGDPQFQALLADTTAAASVPPASAGQRRSKSDRK